MSCNSREEEGASCSADVPKSSKFDSVDSTAEWRSWDQLEACPPSTSPPWDSDDDDESGSSASGPRPSDLYGKFTWKIENFSQINKRELRSNFFEVGGYKWYILVYPQGCDVCNHLSLFLCVADYDKLLPGWSHFAQFTIAVVNKDPKKSKYSDTLHRFCKKEHDWGWKKFMELSKVLDGFTVADTLVIKAQVQVIRENAHRPFRCLDCQYRRELVRVYLTNVESICRRFVEEKREKIGKLMEDTVRWASFRAFWSAVEDNVRHRLSREKVDTILKAVVKFFFIEKEVTSTLVMDALYSGCKALDYQSKNKKGKINGVEVEETVSPVVWVDKDAFVLAGDVLLLLERAANEFLPPYKDDKGPQNRTKDGGPGDDFGKDSVERDERRLIELGRRTVEMFVLAHLFSNRVEVAYQEAIALKRQEELIREEEAAGQAEIELKAKREAAEKEKRTKKKQAKQRRSNRKEKEKEMEEKRQVVLQEPRPREDSTSSRTTGSCLLKETSITLVDIGDEDDDLSVLDTNDDVVGTLGPAVEDGDADRALCEREGSEMHLMMEASFSGGSCVDSTQNGCSNRKHQALLDDSSSTCSSDSVPSINAASNGSTRRRSIVQNQNHNPHRRRDRVENDACDKDSRLAERDGILRGRLGSISAGEASSSCNSGGLDPETIIASLKKRIQWLQQRLLEKEEEVVMLHEQLSLYQHRFGIDAGILDKQNFEPEDSYPKAEVSDPRPPSSSNRRKGEVPENQGKSVDESQDLERVVVKESSLTNGSTVSSSVINGLSQYSSHVAVNSVGNNNPNQSMAADQQKLPSTSHSRGYGLSLSEVSLPNTPTAVIPVNGSSENSVTHSTSHSGLSPGVTTEMELSRPCSAPGLAAAPSGSFSGPSLTHPPSALVRSISASERLGITSPEPTTSICPTMQQSPPITPYRSGTAGVIRNNNHSVQTGSFLSTVSAAGNRIPGSAGGYPYLSSGYSHHPVSAPSGLGDLSSSASSIQTRKLSVVSAQGVSGTTNSAKDELNLTVGTKFAGAEVQADGIYIVDAMENVLTQRAEHGQNSMGFTFGTVTPEMLHLQHQQDQQRECVNAGLLYSELDVQKEDFYQDAQSRQQPGERHNGKESQRSIHNHVHLHGAQKYNPMLQHGLSQSVLVQRGGIHHSVQSVAEAGTISAPMSEEFPHLDIINDLLDDDKMFGAKALNAFLQQSGNQGYHQHLSLHDLHRMCSTQMHPETISVHGNGSERSDRVIPCEDGGRTISSSSERPYNSLRESVQLRHYSHPSLSHSFPQHSGSVDSISGHHWPGTLGDLPVTSGVNGAHSGVDVFIGYPMQSSHLSIPDCPAFSLGQNGYTMYSPIKHP